VGSEAKNSKSLLRLIALATTTPPRSINAVNLKDVLGQIEANGRDRRQINDRLSTDGAPSNGCSNDNHFGTALH
jgi:hypothetical protein